ncbi:2-phosphosulfolactate phosphatase [Dactylosporangium sp. CA-152071]|uniref:2-phosphosulfolactate phosphatase n=1 Tax=Dactylosporangium sp. CA-152071 TaxID=3239933 RepID=UPI003D92EE0E
MTVVGIDADVPAGRVVVVIDVIRAFTTAAVAFGRGAAEIVCVGSAAEGRALRDRHPDRLLIGEVGGLKPDDFDLGNSPLDMAAADVSGRSLIQATSNGTRGLVRHPDAAALLAASAVNAAATVRWITEHHAGVPWTIVCTGRSAEDWACGRHLDRLLGGSAADSAELVAGIREGAAQQALRSAGRPADERVDLTRDLPLCCDVDRFEFAMVGELRDNRVTLAAVPC